MSELHNVLQTKQGKDMQQTILVVDDDEGVRETLEMVLQVEKPYHIVSRKDGVDVLNAIDTLIEMKPVLFIIDYKLPDGTGVHLYDRLHAVPGLEQVPAIILTALDGRSISQELFVRQIEMVEKPFDLDELLQCVEQTIRNSKDKVTSGSSEASTDRYEETL